jgi:hypothetical protein
MAKGAVNPVDQVDEMALLSGLDMEFLKTANLFNRLPLWRQAVTDVLRRGEPQ